MSAPLGYLLQLPRDFFTNAATLAGAETTEGVEVNSASTDAAHHDDVEARTQ